MSRFHPTLAGVITLALALFIAAPASAKESPLELTEVLGSALRNGPEALLPKARALEGEAEALGITSIPDLEIEALTTVGGNDSGSAQVEITQPLRVSDFGSRKALAKSLRDIATLEARAKALDLLQRATQIYTEAWLLQERESLYKRNLKSATATETSLKKAVSQGRADQAEVGLFSAEKLRLEQRSQETRAARLERLAELARLAGFNSLNDYSLSRPDQTALPGSIEALEPFMADANSLRRIYQARAEAAEKRLAVAREDSVIGSFAPRVNLGRDYDGGGSSISAGVVFSLPVWSRNRPETLAAEASRLQAQSGLKTASGPLFEELLHRTYRKAQQSVQAASAYRNSILPAFREVHALTLKRFQQGQNSVLEVWTARERLTGVEEDSLAATVSAVEARLALETIIGTSLEATP